MGFSVIPSPAQMAAVMPRIPSVRRGIVSNLSAGVILIASNLLLVPVSISLAGPSIYGAWAVCYGFVILISQADLGMGAGIVRQLAYFRSKGDFDEEARTNLAALALFSTLALVFALMAYFALPFYFALAAESLEADVVSNLVLCSSVCVAGGLFGRYFIGVLQSHGHFGAERGIAVGGQIIRVAVMVIALGVWRDYLAVLLADVLAILAVTLALSVYVMVKRMGPRRVLVDRRLSLSARNLVQFSIPTFVSSFATLASIQAPLYIVGALVGFTQAAGFSAIMRIYQSSRTVTGWITGPTLPAAAHASARGDGAQLTKLHFHALLMAAVIALAMVSPLAVLAGPILSVWLGPEFNEFGSSFVLIGIAIFVNALYAPGVVVATGAGRPGVVAINNVILCALTLGLSAIGASVFGVLGGAAAIPLAVLLVFPFSQWRTAKVTGLYGMRPYAPVAFLLAVAALGVCLISVLPFDGVTLVVIGYLLTGILLSAGIALTRSRWNRFVLGVA